MRGRILIAGGLSALALLVATATASADTTLGLTSPPSGSSGTACTAGSLFAQATDDRASRYLVPSAGHITSWSINTSGATAGGSVSFVVLRPAGSGKYSVVGVDNTTLPNPLPASSVARFTLSSPIAVQAGDTFGLKSSTSGLACYWSLGSTPTGDTVARLAEPSTPAVGQTLSPASANTPPGSAMNLAVNLVPQEDAGVTTTTAPARPTVGNLALLSSTVTNHGPAVGDITFTDHVPAGLRINAVSAGDGTCSTSGQTITCTIRGLGTGQRVPVNVVVTPGAAQSYTNRVSVAVASGVRDMVSSNNSATATLNVGPRPVAKCVVPRLTRTPSAIAKHVLVLLGCRVKVVKAHSKHIRKGLVITTHPGPGTYPAGKRIRLVVSSGPHKRHHSLRH